MTHEEITAQYLAITQRYKKTANHAQMVYSDAAKQYKDELLALQEQCDHHAPKKDFIDGVACPYCHKTVSFSQEKTI